MGIAGIYTELDDNVFTVSLITTLANDYFKKIHNKKNNLGEYRMPLVLDASDECDWLDTNLQIEQVNELLSSFTNKEFEKNLLEEIKIFDSNYEKKYIYFVNKFDEKIKLLTNSELSSMSNFTNYYK